jgi:SAM-dependent methyltransferase
MWSIPDRLARGRLDGRPTVCQPVAVAGSDIDISPDEGTVLKPPPQALVDALVEGKLALFVGSGTSYQAGAPSWSALLMELVQEAHRQALKIEHEHELTELITGPPEDLIIAAGYLRKQMGETFDHFIKQRFSSKYVIPGRVHAAMGELPVVGIVTTNYDALIEGRFPDWEVVLPGSPEVANVDKNFILKTHGTAKYPSTVVIGPADYQRVSGDTALQKTLERLFQQYTFLFVGFGLSDPDTITVLEQLKLAFGGHQKRHYALIDGTRTGEIRRADLWERLHVQSLVYTPPDEEHVEVAKFLEQLGKLSGKRHVARTLLLIKALATFGATAGAPRLLVCPGSSDWKSDAGEPCYMLPNVNVFPGAPDFNEVVANYLGVGVECLKLVSSGEPFETKNRNPRLGKDSGTYTFQLVSVEFADPPEDLAAGLRLMHDRMFQWTTLNQIRDHAPTMERNGDVFRRISREFGSVLEKLPAALELNKSDDPYATRAGKYSKLPWVTDLCLFDLILRDDALAGAEGVLDLGCGTAALVRAVRARGDLPYVGLDASEAMVTQAQNVVTGVRNAVIKRLDVASESDERRYDGWLFVLNNVVHQLPLPVSAIKSLEDRFGKPYAYAIVETESPGLRSLWFMRRVFECMRANYRRTWFADGDLLALAETQALRVIDNITHDHSISTDQWLASYDLTPEVEATVRQVLGEASLEIRTELQMEPADEPATMLRRLSVLLARPA